MSEQLMQRKSAFRPGDVVSFLHKGKWFVQHVETVIGDEWNKPSLDCPKIGYYPSRFFLEDEGKTWVKGIHSSLLKAQQAAVHGYVLVPVAQLIDTIHEIRSLNSGEYSKAEIEENICTIEAMVEKAQEKVDV